MNCLTHISFLLVLGIAAVLKSGCSTDDITAPDLYGSGNDYPNDIAFNDGLLYYTNYDDSQVSGEHVFLYSARTTGTPIGRFNLHMNGQGYIAIASDGEALYLLSEYPHGVLLKCNHVGERLGISGVYIDGWLPGGIFYRSDTEKLIATFLNESSPDSVAFAIVDRNTFEIDPDPEVRHFPGMKGFFSTTWDRENNRLYALGIDVTDSRRVMVLDDDYNFMTVWTVADSVLGITCSGDTLVAIGPNRTVFNPLNQ